MKKLWLIAPLICILAGCAGTKKTQQSAVQSSTVIDGKLWSSLFQQRAAEYDALCLQAFNLAKMRVEQTIGQQTLRPRAIITDIDETFLDNSPYAVHQGLQGKDYDQASWHDWTNRGIADTLTGALGFFRYAAANNFTIFYITNREESERAGTLKNLQLFNFPFADNEHLIMRQSSSSKEPRRQEVAKKFEIFMLLGDNLADFHDAFDKKTTEERGQNVQAFKEMFGQKFIVLPNPTYGGWEDAIYLNKREWTSAQKDSLVKSAVKNY